MVSQTVSVWSQISGVACWTVWWWIPPRNFGRYTVTKPTSSQVDDNDEETFNFTLCLPIKSSASPYWWISYKQTAKLLCWGETRQKLTPRLFPMTPSYEGCVKMSDAHIMRHMRCISNPFFRERGDNGRHLKHIFRVCTKYGKEEGKYWVVVWQRGNHY